MLKIIRLQGILWLAVMGMGEMNGVVTHSGRSEVCLNSGPFLDNNNNNNIL